MTVRLVFLPRADAAGEPYALLADAQGRVLARGAEALRADGVGQTIVAAPGDLAVARWIDLPARTEAQARSAAAFMLEDEIAASRDQAHLAIGPAEAGGGGRRVAVIVDRAVMLEWLGRAQRLGLRPDILTPDHLLLAPPADGGAVAVRIGSMVAVRAEGLAATCEPDLAPLIVGDRPLKPIEDPATAEAALIAGALAPTINLLQGPFAPKTERRFQPRDLRTPAALVALGLLAPLAMEGVRLVRLENAANEARVRAEALARAALPAASADAADPVAAALSRFSAAGPIGGFTQMAAALFAGIEQTPSVRLTSLTYAEGVLRVTVSAGAYEEIEPIRAQVAQRGFRLSEGGSTTVGGRISVELTVGGA